VPPGSKLGSVLPSKGPPTQVSAGGARRLGRQAGRHPLRGHPPPRRAGLKAPEAPVAMARRPRAGTMFAAYCATDPATTWDHAFARTFFLELRHGKPN
jgi:hypothetical protein